MLRHFLIAWLVYWVAVLLLPVHSLYPATTAALLLQVGFVALVCGSAAAVLALCNVGRMPAAGRCDIPCARYLVWIAIGMSVVGFMALTYDKVIVQGIDYSLGIAAAREEWRRLGDERAGDISSVFSMVGYFLGSAYYVAIVLAITQVGSLKPRERMLAFLASFLLLVGNSALTGGRSSILLIAPMMISAYAARRGIRSRAKVKNVRQRRLLMALGGTALIYVLYVFYQRAAAGDLAALEYALNFLPFLGVEADAWYLGILDSGALSSLSAIFVLAFSYVTHSFATVAAIMDTPNEDKTIIFMHVADMLNRLGLTDRPDTDWFLSGRLPSTPGALWHQFGLPGFLLGSLCLGVAAALAKVWTVRAPTKLLPLGIYTMIEIILMLSPAVFAADFLSFPFIACSFVTLAVIGVFLETKRQRRLGLARNALYPFLPRA